MNIRIHVSLLIRLDGLTDFHIKKPDREKQISYDMAYLWNLKKNNYKNESIYKTENRFTDRANNHGYQREKGGNKLEVWH